MGLAGIQKKGMDARQEHSGMTGVCVHPGMTKEKRRVWE
jgi:hypothetical protein